MVGADVRASCEDMVMGSVRISATIPGVGLRLITRCSCRVRPRLSCGTRRSMAFVGQDAPEGSIATLWPTGLSLACLLMGRNTHSGDTGACPIVLTVLGTSPPRPWLGLRPYSGSVLGLELELGLYI